MPHRRFRNLMHEVSARLVGFIKVHNVGHSNAMLIASNRFHRIASCNAAFFRDGKVEASPTALQESLYDVWAAEPNTELKARHAWLGDNELGRSNPTPFRRILRKTTKEFLAPE